jgi:DNA-binding CsgD family transcriptional regulator
VALREARLFEREHELGVLGRLVESARSGAGGAIVVEGPPGIGKSSLLAAAREAASDLQVLGARGGELEREFPFGVVRQLLEPVLVAADPHERAALLTGAAALAEPVLSYDDRGGNAEPGFSALHGLYWLTANLAARRPVLALVDDLQWGDLPSLRWLVFLARRLEGVPVALLVGTRSPEAAPVADLIDELLAIPSVDPLHPAELSERATTRLAADVLAADPDVEFVSACHRATGGNPFLLRELLGELDRREIAPTRENAGVAGGLSSQGVGRAVRARLRRLGPECAALAQAVAVLGDPVELGLAARLAELDEDTASGAADRLAEAAVLDPGRQLQFVHALVRSSVEAELSGGERALEHERAARLLTEEGAGLDRIALHLLLAPPRRDRDVVETLRRAAAEARARGAPDGAVSYLRRALEEQPPSEVRAAVAHELGEAALRAGDIELAIERLRDATRGLADPRERAQAANSLASALFLGNRSDEAMAELTAVIDQLPESEREQGLRLQATRWVAPRTSTAAWRRLLATGDRFAATQGPARTTGERLALAVAGLHAVRGGTAAEARELAGRALAGGQLLDDPGPESAGFWSAPLVLLWAEALEDAARITDDAIDWARRHGSLPAFSMAAGVRAYLGWRRGALADAEADAASAIEHPAPGFAPWGHGALANILVERGMLAEADELLSQSPFEPGGRAREIFFYLQARARLRAAQQRPEEAVDDLLACSKFEQEWEIATSAVCNWRADAAPLLASLDRHQEAVALAREEVERCRAFGAAGLFGAALRALGALTPGDEGISLLREAVEALTDSPTRLEYALALLDLGTALRRAGRRLDAREPLREALELARSCSADAVATRAHEELVAAGARPRRDPTESRSQLTASELRVAKMAADGLTNREIAQSLFLTENTIHTHLKSVFRKLDIGSRSQLARAL